MGNDSNNCCLKKELIELNNFRKIETSKEIQNGQFLVSKTSLEEYLLLTIPLSEQSQPRNITLEHLRARKDVRSDCLPVLQDYDLETQQSCNSQQVLFLFFKHPCRTLKEEIKLRQSENIPFDEGQIWMIINSCLKGMKSLDQNIGSPVQCTEQNVYIRSNGDIILSDAYKFTRDEFLNTQNSRRMKQKQKGVDVMEKLRNLGTMISKLMEDSSQQLSLMARMLIRKEFSTIKEAIFAVQRLLSQRDFPHKLENEAPTMSNYRLPTKKTESILQIPSIKQNSHSYATTQCHSLVNSNQKSSGSKRFNSSLSYRPLIRDFPEDFKQNQYHLGPKNYNTQFISDWIQPNPLAFTFKPLSQLYPLNQQNYSRQDDMKNFHIYEDNISGGHNFGGNAYRNLNLMPLNHNLPDNPEQLGRNSANFEGASTNMDEVSSIGSSNPTSSSGYSKTYEMIMNCDKNTDEEGSFAKKKAIKWMVIEKNRVAVKYLKDRQRDVIFEVTESDVEASSLIGSHLHHSQQLTKAVIELTPMRSPNSSVLQKK